jgi:hypothetical protein
MVAVQKLDFMALYILERNPSFRLLHDFLGSLSSKYYLIEYTQL